MLVKSQIKYIQSLGQKKFRDEEGAFIAEGPKMVDELLKAPNTRPLGVYATEEWLEANRGWPYRAPAPPVTELKKGELERISGLTTPNQVLAVFNKPLFAAPVYEEGITLLLDNIQDPGNLGTIIRIADWFGVRQILCSPDSADAFNAKTVQSTMGSISRVQVLYGDLGEAIKSQAGLPVFAAALEGEDLYKMERIGKGVILVGNESKGIHPALLEQVRRRITIPRIGGAESLNAAVATGIILSHLAG